MNKKDHFGVKIVISHKRQLSKLEIINKDFTKYKNSTLKISEQDEIKQKEPNKASYTFRNKKQQIFVSNQTDEYLSPIKQKRQVSADTAIKKQKYFLNDLQKSKDSINYSIINYNTHSTENFHLQQKKSSFQSLKDRTKLKKNNIFLLMQGKKTGYQYVQGNNQQKKIKSLFNTLMSRQMSYKSTSNSKVSGPSSSYKHKRIQSSVQLMKAEKKEDKKVIKGMNFSPEKYFQQQYERRLKYFKDFLYRILFIHRIGKTLHMKNGPIHRYKICVKTSNNDDQMVKNMIRKRFWYQVVQQNEACHILWSDKHEKSFYKRQKPIKMNTKFDQELLLMQNQQAVEDEEGQYQTINKKIMSVEDAFTVQRILKLNGHKMIYPQVQSPFITNHIPKSQIMTDKRLLLQNLKEYYLEVLGQNLFQILPKTVYMPTFQKNDYQYLKHLLGQDRKKIWLCKPGEGYSDANGIDFLPTKDVIRTIKQKVHLSDIPNCTYIIQEYMINPFLYHKRKIDLCHYLMITCIGGALKVFWYPEGYIRTSNMLFDMKTKDKQVHFLGEGVQKEGNLFGKHQPQNKISYNDFQRHLDLNHPHCDFTIEKIVRQMKEIALIVVQSSLKILDPQRKGCNFQIFRFNYLIDSNFKVYLLQVQKDPSLYLGNECKVLSHIIPTMIDQTLQLAVDPLYPPLNHFPTHEYHRIGADIYKSLKFECIYDEHHFAS